LGEGLWFWALTLGVAVIGGAALALRWLQVARLIEDTPTSRVRSAAQGYVEITGRGRPLEGVSNLAPLTQRPCVWWRYRVQKKSEGGGWRRNDAWHTVSSGYSVLPFLIDDGTGRCIVQPQGAEVITGESTIWYGDVPWPASSPTTGLLLRSGERSYRYFEERIYEQERVYALGEFRSHRAGDGPDLQAAVTATLDEWKEDQTQLLARFDTDHDGRISLEEWEQARAEARRTVEQQSRDRAALETLNVLSRPEAGQLFLIAALPGSDLAKRYRRKALFAFVGFIAAVGAFGWLLQRAFG